MPQSVSDRNSGSDRNAEEAKIRGREGKQKQRDGFFYRLFGWIFEEIVIRLFLGLFKQIWRAVRAAFHALTD